MQRYAVLVALVVAFFLYGCASPKPATGDEATPTPVKQEVTATVAARTTNTVGSATTPALPTNRPTEVTPAAATPPALLPTTPPTQPPPAPTSTPVPPTATQIPTPTSPPVPSATPSPSPPKPDLIVTDFRLDELGKCAPGAGETVYKLSVTVKNQGTAAASPVPNKAALIALDQHGNGWGGGVMGDELGPIPGGGSRTAIVKVFFYGSDPTHIRAVAPHPFKATVDHLGLIGELDETNNDSAIISLPAPPGCP